MKQKRPITENVFSKLCEIIPGGVNSPVRSCSAVSQLPLVASHAAEDQVFDVDGIPYIDFCMSWGALIHGHCHPTILHAVQKRAAMGTSFGITTSIEEELARKIVQHIPSIEKIRFVSSGTEATMTAARVARGFTKREIIVKFSGNYHGHADFFLVQAGSGAISLPESSSAGIPADIVKHTLCLPYNDIEACRAVLRDPRLNKQIAGVIIEPISGNMGVVPAIAEFLRMLREETQKNGALLIFDEVITGFRFNLGGVQSLYHIKPDLTCLGKIIGGGFPAAAFGGRKEIMDCLAPLGSVYQAGTLSGNPVAMEAGLQALNLLEKKGFYEELERKTNLITQPVREEIAKRKIPACVQQVGSMFTIFFGKTSVNSFKDARGVDLDMYGRFFRYLFERGIYIPPAQHEAWFVSNAHKDKHLEYTCSIVVDFIQSQVTSGH